MKTFVPLVLIALLPAVFWLPAMAQTKHGYHRVAAAPRAPAMAETPLIEGVVKKVNKYSGRVTLFHGPLPNGTPAQTKAYVVKDEDWLDQMKVGERIRFATDPAPGSQTVLRFEPVQ
ncbi:MAG: copper-binding protein [Rhodoferax sp.]|uniref:copper-binding protein n=1 Tax=Rhodoferax sp. TaxID=50421 RepID=UPI0026174190|nr:copper-binding protein [Rhodoferax sp.]MDD5334283.1 copper-binding protein [Rhodoferax sp.]